MERLAAHRYSHWPLAEWLAVRALRRPNTDTRRQAAVLLGRMSSRLAAGALAARLANDDAAVRAAAAQALGDIRDARVVPLLNTAALNDTNGTVRRTALAALGAIGYPASARFLLDLIPHPEDGAAAVRALARLLIDASLRHISTADLQTIAALENQALPPALQNAGHPSSPVGASWRHAQRLAIQELARRQQARDNATTDPEGWNNGSRRIA